MAGHVYWYGEMIDPMAGGMESDVHALDAQETWNTEKRVCEKRLGK